MKVKVFSPPFLFTECSRFVHLQVWMSSIEGFVPRDVIRCFHAYLDFCYIARMSFLTESTLNQLDEALKRFHEYRAVFQQLGVRDPTPSGFSLPRQHAMAHYRQHIENFGAPNGLCSSITESKHIAAVKRPWRRSSRYNAVNQIMLTNQRMEKLTAARIHFTSQGMLDFPTWQPRLSRLVPLDDDTDQSGAAYEDAIHNEVFLAQTHGAPETTFFPILPNHFNNSSELPAQPVWPWPKNWSPKPPRPSSKVPFTAIPSRHRPQRQPAVSNTLRNRPLSRRTHQGLPLRTSGFLCTIQPDNGCRHVSRDNSGNTLLESR
jgi:hypothetical protein